MAGSDAASGFARGLKEAQQSVDNAATDMANQSLNAVRDSLNINSPSKEFAKLGKFAGLGFVESLRSFGDAVYVASEGLGEYAKEGLSNAIGLVFDILETDPVINPVITPVIDLDQVNRGISLIKSGFSTVEGLDLSVDSLNARAISGDLAKMKEMQSANNQPTEEGNVNYTFNQYNTSPKALSRLDIYRQTKNQFAQLKGVRR
jgi:hypothetical protein